ncbi:Purine catabolism regulatory protein-like family protein [Microbacterium ginsengisoli]|uniref:Purine catabolism regulatory protein-like family protein n=1 Tax=Microbacterium ginsengisoli TaxID=400772 RepID=A0A0F0LU99_9MICO|nr:PucR family transcriptional regulator [Microbacterium ginsengisoli]KJL36852.1 Purine catabolism regulatory protein-like family protein [Microbacterium ginsengisoli]
MAEPHVPTLRALLARTELRLRLETPEEALPAGALDAELRWVHSSDLLDPTPFLSEGLALLTTGTQFLATAAEPDEYVAYVERLSSRGVVAVGFGTEVVRAGIPPELAAACREAGLPLVEVPYRTPFIAVARANAEAIAAQAYARRSWALAAQRAISLAALRPGGLGAIVDELAKQLGTWVGLFDASGALTHAHPVDALTSEAAEALTDEVQTLLRRGANTGSALHAASGSFSLQTLGRTGRLRGALVIAATHLDQEERGLVTAVVALAGLALEQRQRLDRGYGALRRGVLQALLAGDLTLARRIARDVWGALPGGDRTVAVTDAASSRRAAIFDWLDVRADEPGVEVFYGRDDDQIVVLAGTGGERVAADLAEAFDLRVGVAAVPDDDLATALSRARLALERGTGRVRRFEIVADVGLLPHVATPDARRLADATLAPLVAHDAAHGTELVTTLRVWLAHDGGHEASARLLGVHRHTVRARVALAEHVLGRDLSGFAARSELWVAMELTGAPSISNTSLSAE